MTTVTLPEDLVARLRAIEGDERTDLSELVARALRKYLSMPERELLVRRAEEREAILERAGITEDEIVEHFHEWRHRQRSRR